MYFVPHLAADAIDANDCTCCICLLSKGSRFEAKAYQKIETPPKSARIKLGASGRLSWLPRPSHRPQATPSTGALPVSFSYKQTLDPKPSRRKQRANSQKGARTTPVISSPEAPREAEKKGQKTETITNVVSIPSRTHKEARHGEAELTTEKVSGAHTTKHTEATPLKDLYDLCHSKGFHVATDDEMSSRQEWSSEKCQRARENGYSCCYIPRRLIQNDVMVVFLGAMRGYMPVGLCIIN